MNGFKNSEQDPRVVAMRSVSANNRERRHQPASIDPSQENKPSGQLELTAAAALCTAYTVSNELTRRSTDSEPSTAELREALAQMTSTLGAFVEGTSVASQYPADKEFKWREYGK
jgi:hypothetical protein